MVPDQLAPRFDGATLQTSGRCQVMARREEAPQAAEGGGCDPIGGQFPTYCDIPQYHFHLIEAFSYAQN